MNVFGCMPLPITLHANAQFDERILPDRYSECCESDERDRDSAIGGFALRYVRGRRHEARGACGYCGGGESGAQPRGYDEGLAEADEGAGEWLGVTSSAPASGKMERMMQSRRYRAPRPRPRWCWEAWGALSSGACQWPGVGRRSVRRDHRELKAAVGARLVTTHDLSKERASLEANESRPHRSWGRRGADKLWPPPEIRSDVKRAPSRQGEGII
ncbi:hypothetical protein BC628DRAFT_289499 [Trametes gibbosa]|nr:hypothetical protein BC628DRAFT_289499 [Trametes gibbosa]